MFDNLKEKLSKLTQKDFLYLLIFIILFISLRYNSFTAPFERDEGEYAYSAWIMRQGIFPYQNSFLQKPPLIIYTYILAQVINPTALWAPRFLAAIFCFVSTFFTGFIAKNLFGKKYFWPAVFVFTPILAFPPHTPFAANTEVFMLTPLLAFFYLYTLKKTSPLIFFLAGIFAALALLYKPICLFIIIFVSLVWVFNLWQEHKKLFPVFYSLVFYVLGGLITAILVCFPFIVTNTFKDLVDQAVIYNFLYMKSWNYFGLSGLFFRLSKIFIYEVVFVVLTIFYFVYPPKHRPWLLPTIIIIGLYSIYKVTIGHYYLLIAPFWALMIAYGLVKISKDKIDLFLTGAVILSIVPFSSQFSKTPIELSEWIYGTLNPFTESQIISQKVIDKTNSSDKIFVAGSEPQILFYSQRQSSTKFVITYPLNINSKYRQEYQNQTITELKEFPPKIIIYSQSQYSDLWESGSPKTLIDYLNDQISKNYKMVGITIRINNKLYWLEDPEPDEIKEATFIMYERNN